MPLYQGGAAGARVRQAQAFRGQLLEQSIGGRAAGRLQHPRRLRRLSGGATRRSNRTTIAVAANQLALEGTRAEQTVGTRNILDVLNAEQELLNSQVLLVTARRDAYVAGFQLLNAMGMAEAEDLNLDGGPLYDPTVNYDRYSRSWSDWDDGPPAAPVATRTVPAGCEQPGDADRKQPRDRAAAISDKRPRHGGYSAGPVDGGDPRFHQTRDRRGQSRRGDRGAAPGPPDRPPAPSPPAEEDVLELDDPVSEGAGLLSDDAAAASRERLATLSALRQRSELPPEAGALEAVVREMLRPMLKDWLDQHLPEIVEELVSREIARITGRDL